MSRLSVIVPTHNRRELLFDKLESLTNQTLSPDKFEVIICVDGSTDGTLEALSDYQANFRLTVLHHAEGKGVVAARNACAARAEGDLLLMSDDDCILNPRTLESHLELHASKPGEVVGVGGLRMPGDKRTLPVAGRAAWIHATGANTSLPKTAFDEVGGYDPYFRAYGGEDADLALRLKERGLPFFHVPGAEVEHVGSLFERGFEDKAFQAGRAVGHIYKKFPRLEVGLMLGAHPVLVGLKKIALGSPLKNLVSEQRRRYELAYIAGVESREVAEDKG